ncbi:hypothetical protein AMK59_5134 [Oryctes borbonicus]|uniref:Gustatory receptor n=1 Tax=Oryctes borbonicus TaxID=1629725 RepID=A0A0T6B3K9_9SCAR|nr:hypothetical protein AMK59_5134 [Oryctes borbonicus]
MRQSKLFFPVANRQIKFFKRPKRTSFLSSLFPITLFCNIIGVWPIEIKIRENTLVTKTSILKSIHTLLLLILQVTLPSIFTCEQNYNSDSSINVVIFEEVVNKYLYTILGCIFIVFTLIQCDKMKKFCRYIFRIDQNLIFLCKDIDYNGKRKQILLNLICGLFFYMAVVLSYYFTAENLVEIIKPMLILIIFTVLANFSSSVELIKQRYQIINDYVGNFSQNKIKNSFGTVLTPLDELKMLSTICSLLCDASEVVNATYTFQLVCFVVLAFLGTLFGMFSTVRAMMDTHTEEDFNFEKMVLKNCSVSVFMAWMLVRAIVVCSSTRNEVS